MTTAAIPKGDTPMPAVETVPGADDRQVVETRFGPMEFTKDQALFMPRGVLGFAEHKNFGLAYLPNKFIDQLMLLQSLNDASGIIEPRDLHGACNTMEIEPEDAVIALIVTVRDAGGQPQVTVNLRAPIVLDTNSRTGWQYVLPNSKYSVRHLLNLDAVAETPSAER